MEHIILQKRHNVNPNFHLTYYANVNQIMTAQQDTKFNQHYCYSKVIASKVNLGFLVFLHSQMRFYCLRL